MVYVSVAARVLLNVEALNMSESVGNFVRHKRAPVVVPVGSGDQKTFVLRYVPVISGQSIAHAYQAILAEIATLKGKPACPLCRQEVFVKHASDEIIERIAGLGGAYAKELLARKNYPHDFERLLIENCVVEDVGGFLYTGPPPVKRTSRFSSSYALPSLSHVHAVATEAQFHVRHDPFAVEQGQAIYYVETGSALYALNLALDLGGVGCTSAVGKEPLKDKAEREALALEALAQLLGNASFGAKRSRFLPHWDAESLVVAVSHPLPFNCTAGHTDRYIVSTVERASRHLQLMRRVSGNAFVRVYYYVAERSPAQEPKEGAEKVASPVDALMKTLEFVGMSRCR